MNKIKVAKQLVKLANDLISDEEKSPVVNDETDIVTALTEIAQQLLQSQE